MINLLSVFIGGGIGSIFRWLCSSLISSHWGTMFVNVSGAFLIGAVYSYFAKMSTLSQEFKLFVMTGLLGGFTTFSTYLLNFTTLANDNRLTEAFLYLIGSVLTGCIFLFAGMKIVDNFI